MQIPWRSIHSGWLRGAIGALAVAASLLLIHALMPKDDPLDQFVSTAPAMSQFLLNEQTLLFAIPTSSGEEASVDHILLIDEATSQPFTAYRSHLRESPEGAYAAATAPVAETGRISRILYQSVPYLTEGETAALMAQKDVPCAAELTIEEIYAAAQLAIASVVDDTHFDFDDLELDYPNVKPLYDYYMSLPDSALDAQSGVTFAIDTRSAMWISGAVYGPIHITCSLSGYASSALFDLQLTAKQADKGAYLFKTADNRVITSVTPGTPFYLQLPLDSPLLAAKTELTLSAVAKDAMSHGGGMLRLEPDSMRVSSGALAVPIPAGTLFTVYSERSIPFMEARVTTAVAVGK